MSGETLLQCGVGVGRGIQSLDGDGHVRWSSEDRPDRAVRLNEHHENHGPRGDLSRRQEYTTGQDRTRRLTDRHVRSDLNPLVDLWCFDRDGASFSPSFEYSDIERLLDEDL